MGGEIRRFISAYGDKEQPISVRHIQDVALVAVPNGRTVANVTTRFGRCKKEHTLAFGWSKGISTTWQSKVTSGSKIA